MKTKANIQTNLQELILIVQKNSDSDSYFIFFIFTPTILKRSILRSCYEYVCPKVLFQIKSTEGMKKKMNYSKNCLVI